MTLNCDPVLARFLVSNPIGTGDRIYVVKTPGALALAWPKVEQTDIGGPDIRTPMEDA